MTAPTSSRAWRCVGVSTPSTRDSVARRAPSCRARPSTTARAAPSSRAGACRRSRVRMLRSREERLRRSRGGGRRATARPRTAARASARAGTPRAGSPAGRTRSSRSVCSTFGATSSRLAVGEGRRGRTGRGSWSRAARGSRRPRRSRRARRRAGRPGSAGAAPRRSSTRIERALAAGPSRAGRRRRTPESAVAESVAAVGRGHPGDLAGPGSTARRRGTAQRRDERPRARRAARDRPGAREPCRRSARRPSQSTSSAGLPRPGCWSCSAHRQPQSVSAATKRVDRGPGAPLAGPGAWSAMTTKQQLAAVGREQVPGEGGDPGQAAGLGAHEPGRVGRDEAVARASRRARRRACPS